MSKLTKAARDQECTIQIHPYCLGGTETTVFAHAPSEDKCLSKKSPDWWGADSCHACHDIVDSRRRVDICRADIDRCFMRGIYRTIKRRIEQGLIKIDE